MVLPTSRYLFHFLHIFTFYFQFVFFCFLTTLPTSRYLFHLLHIFYLLLCFFNVFISASLISSLHRAIYFISSRFWFFPATCRIVTLLFLMFIPFISTSRLYALHRPIFSPPYALNLHELNCTCFFPIQLGSYTRSCTAITTLMSVELFGPGADSHMPMMLCLLSPPSIFGLELAFW